MRLIGVGKSFETESFQQNANSKALLNAITHLFPWAFGQFLLFWLEKGLLFHFSSCEELVFAASESEPFGDPNPIPQVCTLGRNIGAILFMDGRRVRNSPLNELYTSILAGGFSKNVKILFRGPAVAEAEPFFEAFCVNL